MANRATEITVLLFMVTTREVVAENSQNRSAVNIFRGFPHLDSMPTTQILFSVTMRFFLVQTIHQQRLYRHKYRAFLGYPVFQ